MQSRWYRPTRTFFLLLAGYPLQPGEIVFLEVATKQSGIQRVGIPLDENPERWRLQKVTLDNFDAVNAIRIVASDTSTKSLGWVGFSQPFTIEGQNTLMLLKQLAFIVLCVAASLVAVIGPGLVLRARVQRTLSPVWLPVPGILLLTMLGVLAWKGPSALSPHSISRMGLLLLFLLVGRELVFRPITSLISRTELHVLGLTILLIVLAAAKSVYSIGPAGELFEGQISRTLESGSRADSRIPFHVVQLVALRKGAYGALAMHLFAPWNFSHRGPIAGLAASPITLASGAQPPDSMPDQTWTVFDPQGFAAYRIAMIVMSAASLIIVFGVARLFLDDRWALLAFIVAATAPFTIHEIFFTWPKLLTASFVLLGVYLVHERHYLAAGSATGIGYLCHPSALFWFPGLLASIALLSRRPGSPARAEVVAVAKRMAVACAGLLVWLVAWRLITRAHFQQTTFLQYFSECGGLLPCATANWLRSRWVSALNTLVPLYLFLFHRTDRDLIALDGRPRPWVQFIQQYWCSIAFGCGAAFYFAVLRLVGAAFHRAKAWLIFVFIPTFVFFVLYFGAPNTGLLRESLHPWFLSMLLFAVVMWRKQMAGSKLFWQFTTFAFAIRGIEALLVLVPFGSWSRGHVVQPPYVFSDLCALMSMFLGGIGLVVYVVSYCRRMQAITLSASSNREACSPA